MTDLIAYAQKCEQTAQAVAAAGPRLVLGMAQLGLSLRIRDIQRNGLPGRPRYSTNPFPTFFFLPKALNQGQRTYVKKNKVGTWGAFRAAGGLQKDFVDGTFSGRMFRSLQPRFIASSGYTYRSDIVSSTREDGKKLRHMKEEYGDFMRLLPSEQGEANLYATREVTRIIQQGMQ